MEYNTLNIGGFSLKEMIGQNTENIVSGGGVSGNIADRIAELSVPAGLAYIPEFSHNTLEYRSEHPYYTYTTVPDDLYDTLIGLVSVNPTTTKQTTRSGSRGRKLKLKGVKTTRRNV